MEINSIIEASRETQRQRETALVNNQIPISSLNVNNNNDSFRGGANRAYDGPTNRNSGFDRFAILNEVNNGIRSANSFLNNNNNNNSSANVTDGNSVQTGMSSNSGSIHNGVSVFGDQNGSNNNNQGPTAIQGNWCNFIIKDREPVQVSSVLN